MFRKRSFLVLFMLFCLPCWREVCGRDTLSRLSREMQEACVGITCKGAEGQYFGTGTVIRRDGLILTSSTVVPPGASHIRIFFPDGRVLPAARVKVDPAIELSLVEVDGVKLTSLPLGESKESSIGEIVFSLGNAFGRAASDGRVSVGMGLLSGKYVLEDTLSESTYKGEVLETDAPLNPGSDGGALVDSTGSLIGLLSLNYSRSRYLGTAVPVHVLVDSIKEAVGPLPSKTGEKRFAIQPDILNEWRRSTVAIKVKRTEDAEMEPTALLRKGKRFEFIKKRHPGIFSRPEGCVTGVCVSETGQILTSWYNVAGKVEKIQARDIEGEWIQCKLVAKGEVDDLALIEAEKGKWKEARFGDPPELAPGRAVFVLGKSPDPSALTVTGGIVSAARRNNDRFFQHDAALNPGNSGGPIVDRSGELLGIAVYVGHLWPEWSMNSGIGFGVRPDRVKEAVSALKKGEDLLSWSNLPFLGVKKMSRLKSTGPARVEALEGYPAEKAGIKTGDKIVKVASRKVETWTDLIEEINNYKAGDKVKVTVVRKGEEKEFEVTLGSRPGR